MWIGFFLLARFSFEKIGLFSLALLIPYLLLLFTCRFYVSNRLRCLLDARANSLKSFISMLPSAAYRLLTAALWLLPFAAVLYRFYQYIFILPATTFSNDFTAIGAFVAADAAPAMQLLLGTGVFFVLLFLTGFIFIYGFRRCNAFDLSQESGLSFKASLLKARKIRKNTRTNRLINTVMHACILLPAVILPCVLPLAQLRPLLTGKAMNDLQLIYAYLTAGIVSDGTLILSAVIFLVLYLPFLPFRKLHNIAAVMHHE